MGESARAPKLKLHKGDRVIVLSGKDVGKEGEITRVIPERRMVIVDGVNVAKRHQRSTKATMQGGIIDKDMPLHISNVAIICPSCGPSRVGYKVTGSGETASKARVCKKCGKEI
jgi:large subunit ribosomal protein L24